MTPTTVSFRAFSIRNLADHVIDRSFDEPWVSAPAIPKFETREQYKTWMADSASVVPLFSLIEGHSPNLRVSHTNQAHRVHGIVCDYDTPLKDDEVTAGLKRIRPEYPVYAWNRTRRGGVRLVFRFEKPIFFYGKTTFKAVMQRAMKELRLKGIFPGFDEDCFLKADQTYAAGDGWFFNTGSTFEPAATSKPTTLLEILAAAGFAPATTSRPATTAFIRDAAVHLWISDALKKSDDFATGLPEIPLSKVEEEVHKRFPGRWTGPFTEGSRGIRFWDPTADNPTAAIVRKEGMTAFTGDRPFVSWKDVFGQSFIQAFLEDKCGQVLAKLHCDGQKRYYRQLGNEQWDMMNTEQARRHLKVKYGLSDSVAKSSVHSEVDMMLHQLEVAKRVDGAIPFPHNKEPIVDFNGTKFLNTTTARLMTPALDPQEWGENFPWIADFAKGLAKDQKNFEVLLAEASHWIKGCHAGVPTRGHVVFLAGPPGTGKTFWSRQVLGRMIGGYASVTRFFTGESKYLGEAFSKALWVIDDAIPATDRKKHAAYSGNVKACAANPTFDYAVKYGYEGEAPFSGRLYVTLNNDSTSLEMLPDSEMSLIEKVSFIQTSSREAPVSMDETERYAILDRELPYFMRWLLDMPLPDWLKADPRFGFKAWQDPELLEEAKAAATSSYISEVIAAWRKDYTAEDGKKVGEFIGTSAEILAALHMHSTSAKLALGGMTAIGFGRHLRQLTQTANPDVQFLRRDKIRGNLYRIVMTP
jgi:hypothetical protein